MMGKRGRENLGGEINSPGGAASPSYFEDERGHATLYFLSARASGFAPDAGSPDSDIYFSVDFGPAQLTPGLNTVSDDSRPNVRHAGHLDGEPREHRRRLVGARPSRRPDQQRGERDAGFALVERQDMLESPKQNDCPEVSGARPLAVHQHPGSFSQLGKLRSSKLTLHFPSQERARQAFYQVTALLERAGTQVNMYI